tara:strand:+ start:234 stop:536 length:303 start_codon:yes stop_codon:yes gene_type:complete
MITAMTVLTAEKHPNADSLWIYTLRSNLKKPVLQVCANLTNVYEAGDLVAVCQVGHDVGEFVITERRVRGALSQGMMIGVIADVTSGDDVTEACSDWDLG